MQEEEKKKRCKIKAAPGKGISGQDDRSHITLDIDRRRKNE
jgi:hypothetical protein